MIRLFESIVVTRPVEEAFAYVSDFANVPEWDPGVTSARQVGDGELGPGTRFELVARFAGRDVPMAYVITHWDPPHRVVLEGRAAGLTAVDSIRFEPHELGSRIDYSAEFTLRGFLRLLEPLLRGRFERMGLHALAGLEKVMNGDQTAQPPAEPGERDPLAASAQGEVV